MTSRLLVFLLFASVGCALIGIILIASSDRQSLTLADSAPSGESRSNPPQFNVDLFTETLNTGGAAVDRLDWRAILYGSGALLMALLALRALGSTNIVKLAGFLKSFRAPSDDCVGESSKGGFVTTRSRRIDRYEVSEPSDEVAPPLPLIHARTRAYSFEELSRHFRMYAHGLTGKMMVTFTGIVALFGLTTLVLVDLTLTSSLRGHAEESAKVTAVNIGDGVSGYLWTNNRDGLRELLRKHAAKPGMAYVLVQDRTGEVFAHSFPVLPAEMQPLPSTRDGIRRMLEIGENTVIEMSVPVLDGRLGTVRVGVWREEIDATIEANIAPLLKWIALIAIGGTLVAAYLVWKINQPIVTLVRAAREISHGELDAPGGCRVDDSSEYGELSRAFERMRSSVKAAMTRLGSEP
jgi:hypothetical protein